MILNDPEFSRPFTLDTIGTTPRTETIEANPAECAALARRFGLVSLNSLSATATLLENEGAIIASGQIHGDAVQSCVASGTDVPVNISEPLLIRFVTSLTDETTLDEVEIDAEDCDVVEHDGQIIDLGEGVAQSFALALDPFPRAPNADELLKQAGVLSEGETGPFAGLKGMLGN